jgi:hypothetical protein
METTEGNKLIHFFMHGDKEYRPLRLFYDTQWDALMPVVEKIESDYFDHVYSVEIVDHKTTITRFKSLNEKLEQVMIVTGDSKINSTWKAVAMFIVWHNQLK